MTFKTVLTATIVLAATGAHAETMMTKGKGMGQAETQIMQMGEDHMIMHTNTAYSTYEMDSADDPMQGMSGPCFGAMEVMAGKVSGSGYCAFTHQNGDMASIHWSATGMSPEGAVTGEWHVTGGTGKWMGATGGGTFSSMTDQATGMSENTVEGEVTLN